MNYDLDSALDVVIKPITHDLGDQFEVRRALPNRVRRMVGPFVFLDQMGPNLLAAGRGLDVRPHPHIGLATVTYLLQGEILHRDSLGTVQAIRPGEVNWMNAGAGIVHSERTSPESREHPMHMFGLQCWVALPKAQEESAPTFSHTKASALPTTEGDGARATIIAGSCFGLSSPVVTQSGLVYVDLAIAPGGRIELPADYSEQALYIVAGQLDLGRDGLFDAGQLLVLKPGARTLLKAGGTGATRLMLLGGEPMDGPRYLSWNFVSSSAERIEQAKKDWRDQRFPAVPGETEFIPLPDIPGKPVRYP